MTVHPIHGVPDQKYEVTPLELFFDLVFMFALSQLSQHLFTYYSWRGAAETLVMLLAIFAVWFTTSWSATMWTRIILTKEMHMANSNEQKAMEDLKAIAPEFAKLTQDFLFGDIWKRPGLSQRDKSLITVTCLVALNRIEQVDFHLKKAFENGLTKEELVAAITHIAFYAGWPTAASGFGHLKKIIDQQ